MTKVCDVLDHSLELPWANPTDWMCNKCPFRLSRAEIIEGIRSESAFVTMIKKAHNRALEEAQQ